MRLLVWPILATIVLLPGLGLLADRMILKNGVQYLGVLLQQDDAHVWFRTNEGRMIRMKKSRVSRIIYEKTERRRRPRPRRVSKPVKHRKSRRTATRRSAVRPLRGGWRALIPGWEQFHRGDNRSGTLYAGGFAFGLGAYVDARKRVPSAGEHWTRSARFLLAFGLRFSSEEAFFAGLGALDESQDRGHAAARQANLFALALAVIYVLNIQDATGFGFELSGRPALSRTSGGARQRFRDRDMMPFRIRYAAAIAW